jgi:hypothetical protein
LLIIHLELQQEIALLYIFINYSLNGFHLELQQEIALSYIFINYSPDGFYLYITTRNSFIIYVLIIHLELQKGIVLWYIFINYSLRDTTINMLIIYIC